MSKDNISYISFWIFKFPLCLNWRDQFTYYLYMYMYVYTHTTYLYIFLVLPLLYLISKEMFT
jgi:hypothetical protein